MTKHLTLSETVFLTVMATAMGVAWWAYSLFTALFPRY